MNRTALAVTALTLAVAGSPAAPASATAPRDGARDVLTPVSLGALPGSQGMFPTDVNDRDQVVGFAYVDLSTARTHAWLWSHGRLRDLGTLEGPDGRSSASAVNDRGQVLGSTSSPSGDVPFLWEDGRMTALTTPADAFAPVDLDERGRVVGNRGGSDGQHAVLWQRGRLTPLPAPADCVGTTATALADSGSIVGTCYRTGSQRRDLLWERGGRTVRELDPGMEVSDVSDRGWLAGRDAATGRATVWQPDGRGGWTAHDLGARAPSEAVDFGRHREVAVAGSGLADGADVGVWRRGSLTALPGSRGYRPNAMNERGHVVGSVFGDAPVLWR